MIIPCLLTTALFFLAPLSAFSQGPATGVAWQLSGRWHINQGSATLSQGDSVSPGEVLTAEPGAEVSVVVLMPDGQRLFFDCHDRHSCLQGFRIPALLAQPDRPSLDFFRAVSKLRHNTPRDASQPISAIASEVEEVCEISSDDRIKLACALPGLPPGTYRLSYSKHQSTESQSTQALQWSGPQDKAVLPIAGPGIYVLRLFGTLDLERMHAVILCVQPSRMDAIAESLKQGRQTLRNWNEVNPGWPMHQFLQLYLVHLAGEP